MKFRVYDKQERKMYSPEEVEDKNWSLGSNGIILATDKDSFKDGKITLWATDWREPSFAIGKTDVLDKEIYQGDILRFTLDPVLADTVSGGGEIEHFVVSNIELKMDISTYNFTYDADILDSPAVIGVEIIGNVYQNPDLIFDFPELKQMLDLSVEEDEDSVTEEVQCDLCSHKWVAVYYVGTEKLECPNCGNTAYFESTNPEDDD